MRSSPGSGVFGSICEPRRNSVAISVMRSSARPKFSMRPDDVVRLTHMRDAAASALRFIGGRGRDELPRSKDRLSRALDAIAGLSSDQGKSPDS